jgi:CheY-like chemotaxis protein
MTRPRLCAEPAARAERRSAQGTAMIFIVDDDASVRISLTRLMQSVDHKARAFASAQAYLDEVDAGGAAADCVILDLHLPGMSGLELLQVINRREPRVPVIILTASDDAELAAKALVTGAAKVLKKPCDSMILLRAIAAATGQPPPASPPSESSPTRAGTRSTAVGNKKTRDPDHFTLGEGHALYRPVGSVSFEKAVTLVRSAIAAAKRRKIKDLLVNMTGLTGFAAPDTFQRFLMAVEWADEARLGVRLAMVAREEMIHPQKFGVLVAANRGMVSNVFPTELEARAWLTKSEGE